MVVSKIGARVSETPRSVDDYQPPRCRGQDQCDTGEAGLVQMRQSTGEVLILRLEHLGEYLTWTYSVSVLQIMSALGQESE